MSVSFRKFVEFVHQDEVTDEQINELFGVFATNRVDKIKASRDAVRARLTDKDRDAKWDQAKAKSKLDDPTLSDAERAELKKKAWAYTKNKSGGGVSAASKDRASEVEWLANASSKPHFR